MTRFACLRVVMVAAGAALLAGAGARSAHASDAVSVYVAASRVDMMPSDDAATTVAIHGAFILLKADGSWEPPRCGYMHFRCPAGSEAMCRMQWKDVRQIGTASSTCAGFGTLNMVTTATIRTEGTALSSPDAWELGIGVTTGVSVGSQCPVAKALTCPLAPGTGGTGGSGTAGAGGASGTAGTSGGGGGAGGDATGGGGKGGSGATGAGGDATGSGGKGGSGTAGAGGSQVLGARSNCAIAPGETAPSGWTIGFSIVSVLAATTMRRRRRR